MLLGNTELHNPTACLPAGKEKGFKISLSFIRRGIKG
jgi:hypothetical protein